MAWQKGSQILYVGSAGPLRRPNKQGCAAIQVKIVKPSDWQFVPATSVDVIVEGTDQGDLECLLVSKDAYFTLPPGQRPILARARLRPFGQSAAVARLSGLQGWGSCVLCVIPVEAEVELAASGINLAQSKTTTWLNQELRLPPEEVQANIRYPLPLVASTISHAGGDVLEEVDFASELAKLLSSGTDSPPISLLPLFNSEQCDAMSVMDRACCIGFDDPKMQKLLVGSPYQSSAPYLGCFRDAYAILPGGVVMPEGNRIWSDSAVAAFFNDPMMTQYPRMFRANGLPGLVLDHIGTEQDILDVNEVDRMPGIPMLASHIAYQNHAHWLLNSLPPVFWLRDEIRHGRICVLVPQVSDYFLDTLRSLGIPRSSILRVPAGTYHFPSLLFPSTLSIHANSFPPPALAPMFEQIRSSVAEFSGAPGAERIYITRIGSGTQRKMCNELALIEALLERGFVCVAPHELSFRDEVRCFSRARIVVGQLGAGLANIGFAPPGCHVLEITSHNYTGNDYWFMCHVLQHRFSRLMVRTETVDDLTLADFSFDLPLDEILRVIDVALTRM